VPGAFAPGEKREIGRDMTRGEERNLNEKRDEEAVRIPSRVIADRFNGARAKVSLRTSGGKQ
jgi:hypothetical protein